MFAVRYVALAALVVWVGGMILLLLAGAESAELVRLVQRVALACGSLILLALLTMKFVGPPPHAFPLRAIITAAMLAIAIASGFAAARDAATVLMVVNTAGGLVLLSFYARE